MTLHMNTSYHMMMYRTVGILHLSYNQIRTIPTDKKKFRGQAVYCMKKFTPFFNQYAEYCFWVKTKRIKDVDDQYVVIDFDITENKRNEVIGVVCRYIGRVGDLSIDSQVIRENAISNWINWNKFPYITQSISNDDLTSNRINYLDSDQPIISIDPVGCVDIDDAVSYRRIENGHQISIHIADPSSYLIEGSALDDELKKRAETVYLNDTTHHMFPPDLTTKFSLNINKHSRAFSIHLILDDKNRIINRMIEKTLIRVTYNMNYQQYDDIIASEEITNYPLDMMRTLYDICKDLYRELLDPQANNYSSKKMVEVLMVLANKTAAEIMVGADTKEPVLIRSHLCTADRQLHESSPIDPKLIELNNMLQTESAQLNLYNNNNYNRHDGLNLEVYTHFTSPIRRYSDIMVHRTLYNILNHKCTSDRIFKNEMTSNHIIHLNTCKRHYKLVRRFEKMIRLYRTIDRVIGQTNDELNFDAKIIMINEKINRSIVVKIWIADIYGEKDNIFSINLVDHKIRNFRTIEFEKSNQIISIKIINKGEEKKYVLYQNIMVGLILCPLQMERIVCVINE